MNISNGTLTSFSNLDGLSVHRFAIHYAYDADGLPTVVSDGASAVSNGWDAATGGLVKTRGAEGTEVGYLYRNDGAVTSVVSVAGVKSLDLDPYGRWTRAESAAGTAVFGYSDWNGLAAVLCAYGIGRAQHRLPSCASQTPFVRNSGFSRAHENWVSCLVDLVIGWSSALEHGKPAALTVIG